MKTLVWMYVGTLALLLSMGAMVVRLDSPTRLLSAGMAMVLWAVWSFGARDLTEYVGTDTSAVKVHDENTALAYVGLVFAAIMLLFLLQHGFEQLRGGVTDRDQAIQ